MNKPSKRAPELRFKGFDDVWEQRRVSDIGKSYYGGGTPKTSIKEYWDGDLPWIQSSDIVEDILQIKQTNKSITQLGLENSAAKLIPKNSIAIVTRVGVGKLALMPYEYSTSQDFLSISDLNVHELFGTYIMHKLLQKEKSAVQGTSIKGITKNDLLSLRIIIPHNFMEQQKIGSFFQVLDNVIALHQRKLELLKQLKQGYLENIFPRKGEYRPKLRFANFDGNWEQRKLNEWTSYSSSNKSTNNLFENFEIGEYAVYDANKTVGYINEYDQKDKYISIIKDGAGVGRIALRNGESSIIGTMGYLLPERVDIYFLYSILECFSFKKYITGTTIPHIYFKDYGKEKVFAPAIIEQKSIGRLFNIINEIIALNKDKIKKIKMLKKAYLQKMFI